MTLRRRLAIRYGMIVGVCLLLLAGLAHHEFIVEPRVRRELGVPKPSGSPWGEYAELVFHALIPVVLGTGWWLMRRTLAPFDALARRVEQVHAANLSTPMPRTGNRDEVDRFTEIFNGLITRLDRSIRQIREFTLHASHELKTPLTVMRVQLDTALREGAELTAGQRDWIRGQMEEVQRLARIVDTLTLLAKADAGLVKLERQAVRLDALVRESFEDAEMLGEQAGIRVALGSCPELTLWGDRDRLRQLLLNLVDNALKYNHRGGRIEIAVQQKAGLAEVAITNTGPGVAPEFQPRVFDRFVRGADARSLATEGCGLGLAICQWIVQGHGGSIRLESLPGQTTTVTVLLPLAADDPRGEARSLPDVRMSGGA